MVTGRVFVDLTTEPDLLSSADRKALSILEHVPTGASVTVDIGHRGYISDDIVHWLHAHAERLVIEIVGTDPAAVTRFVRAAREGHEWRSAG